MRYDRATRMVFIALVMVGLVTQGTARYAVTAEPLDVGGPRLCLAVDPSDVHGVWWWQSWAGGCASRDTGPGLFRPDQATVVKEGEVVRVSFRLGLHGIPPQPDHLDVRIVLEGDRMRSTASGSSVAVVSRDNLDIQSRMGHDLPRIGSGT